MENKIQVAIDHLKVGNFHQPHIDMAIECLEKQIPKSPLETQELMDVEWLCPVCMCTVGDCVNVDNYCRECGQKILF